METRVKRNGETVLDIIRENDNLRKRVNELEAERDKEFKDILRPVVSHVMQLLSEYTSFDFNKSGFPVTVLDGEFYERVRKLTLRELKCTPVECEALMFSSDGIHYPTADRIVGVIRDNIRFGMSDLYCSLKDLIFKDFIN